MALSMPLHLLLHHITGRYFRKCNQAQSSMNSEHMGELLRPYVEVV